MRQARCYCAILVELRYEDEDEDEDGAMVQKVATGVNALSSSARLALAYLHFPSTRSLMPQPRPT